MGTESESKKRFYLGPARNCLPESERVLVDSGKVIMTRNVTWEHLPSSCPIKTQSKHSEEGEGDDGTDDGEASLVEVDSNCEQVLPRVSSGRATVVLNNRGSSTTGKVSLEREGGKLSSATSYGEGLAGSSASTVDETSSKKSGLPAA